MVFAGNFFVFDLFAFVGISLRCPVVTDDS